MSETISEADNDDVMVTSGLTGRINYLTLMTTHSGYRGYVPIRGVGIYLYMQRKKEIKE